MTYLNLCCAFNDSTDVVEPDTSVSPVDYVTYTLVSARCNDNNLFTDIQTEVVWELTEVEVVYYINSPVSSWWHDV